MLVLENMLLLLLWPSRNKSIYQIKLERKIPDVLSKWCCFLLLYYWYIPLVTFKASANLSLFSDQSVARGDNAMIFVWWKQHLVIDFWVPSEINQKKSGLSTIYFFSVPFLMQLRRICANLGLSIERKTHNHRYSAFLFFHAQRRGQLMYPLSCPISEIN